MWGITFDKTTCNGQENHKIVIKFWIHCFSNVVSKWVYVHVNLYEVFTWHLCDRYGLHNGYNLKV